MLTGSRMRRARSAAGASACSAKGEPSNGTKIFINISPFFMPRGIMSLLKEDTWRISRNHHSHVQMLTSQLQRPKCCDMHVSNDCVRFESISPCAVTQPLAPGPKLHMSHETASPQRGRTECAIFRVRGYSS